MASSGRLARVSQRWHITSSQPYPPLRHCAIVGDGCAGPPKPSICSDHNRHSAASASRMAFLACSRAFCALILAPWTRSPKIRCRLRPPIGALSVAFAGLRNPTRNGGRERSRTPTARSTKRQTRRAASLRLRVVEQRHKSEVHMQLLMAVKQRPARIVGHKVDFDLLVSTHHDNILHDPGRRLSGYAGQFETVAMQMHGMDVVAGVAHAQPIAFPLAQME